MYNKLFYGVRGGIELLDRKWKGLSDHVTLECDGKDLTQRIKDLKVHAILFLNIPSYGGGTRPWNKSAGNNSTDDGLIEVIGLTIMQIVSIYVYVYNMYNVHFHTHYSSRVNRINTNKIMQYRYGYLHMNYIFANRLSQ